MKKVLIIISLFFLFGCSSNKSFNSYSDFKQSNPTFKYFAEAKNFYSSSYASPSWGASKTSQDDANNVALDHCKEKYFINCFVSKEGNKSVWNENVKNLKEEIKKQEIFDKKRKEEKLLAKQKEEEEKLLASINVKKTLCSQIGFEDNTELMANCVFQLISDENKKKQLDEQNAKIALANKKKEEELKKQTLIIEQEIIRQKQANQDAAIDQFLIDLANIFGGTQSQTTRTTPSGEMCNLQRRDVQSNNKICTYYCPSGYYSKQIRNYQVCPQVVRR